MATFAEFRDLMRKRGHTIDDLVAIFHGKLDENRPFFERVMSCKWQGEDRSWVEIPYRSVLAFYYQELDYWKDANPDQRLCACGCGVPVSGRQKWSRAACRKRVQRKVVTDQPKTQI